MLTPTQSRDICRVPGGELDPTDLRRKGSQCDFATHFCTSYSISTARTYHSPSPSAGDLHRGEKGWSEADSGHFRRSEVSSGELKQRVNSFGWTQIWDKGVAEQLLTKRTRSRWVRKKSWCPEMPVTSFSLVSFLFPFLCAVWIFESQVVEVVLDLIFWFFFEFSLERESSQLLWLPGFCNLSEKCWK